MLLPPTHAQVTGGVYEQLSTLGLPNCLERRLRAPAEAEQAGTGQAQNRRGCRDKKPRRMGPHPAYPRPTRWGLLSCNKEDLGFRVHLCLLRGAGRPCCSVRGGNRQRLQHHRYKFLTWGIPCCRRVSHSFSINSVGEPWLLGS